MCAGDPSALGPGRYEAPDGWKGNSKHGSYLPAPGFDGGAPRFAAPRGAVVVGPAPGAYEARDISKIFKPLALSLAPFGASEARLPPAHKLGPGPGAYELRPAWLQRSFNVTWDDAVVA